MMEPDSTTWWGEPDIGAYPLPPSEEFQGCSAKRMWMNACTALSVPEPHDFWQQLEDASPSDSLWHTLRNCVAYQAGVWLNLLSKEIEDVMFPAAFKLAVVLRHSPAQLIMKILPEMMEHHEDSHELVEYIVSLLSDDWPARRVCRCGHTGRAALLCAGLLGRVALRGGLVGRVAVLRGGLSGDALRDALSGAGGRGAGLRDRLLFGDLELAILAAAREEYDAHAMRVRDEYSAITNLHYVELRVKVLNQFSRVRRLFHTPEFECFEDAARENMEREINTLREHLLTGRRD